MTITEKTKVAGNMTSNDLMDKLVTYGGMLETSQFEVEKQALLETVEVIKAELSNRIAGL